MNSFDAAVEKVVHMVGTVLTQIGTIVLPVVHYIEGSQHAGALKAGIVILLFVLGIIFWLHSYAQFCRSEEKEEEMDLPAGFFFARMVMKVFYLLLVIYLFMASVKGHQVIDFGTMRFDNFGEWYENCQFFGALVVFEFLLTSALCILRLKPIRLVKYWVHTTDYAIMGLLLGNFYLFLVEVFSQNWLGSLLVYLVGIFLDTVIPFLFVTTALAPVYAFLIGFGSIFVRFFQSFTFQVETKSGKVYEGNSLFFIMDMLLP